MKPVSPTHRLVELWLSDYDRDGRETFTLNVALSQSFSIPTTYFNSDNNLRSVSLAPPLVFQPQLDGDSVRWNGECASGCLSQSRAGESEMGKKKNKRAGVPAIRPVFSLNAHFIMALMGFILASGHTSLVRRWTAGRRSHISAHLWQLTSPPGPSSQTGRESMI